MNTNLKQGNWPGQILSPLPGEAIKREFEGVAWILFSGLFLALSLSFSFSWRKKGREEEISRRFTPLASHEEKRFVHSSWNFCTSRNLARAMLVCVSAIEFLLQKIYIYALSHALRI